MSQRHLKNFRLLRDVTSSGGLRKGLVTTSYTSWTSKLFVLQSQLQLMLLSVCLARMSNHRSDLPPIPPRFFRQKVFDGIVQHFQGEPRGIEEGQSALTWDTIACCFEYASTALFHAITREVRVSHASEVEEGDNSIVCQALHQLPGSSLKLPGPLHPPQKCLFYLVFADPTISTSSSVFRSNDTDVNDYCKHDQNRATVSITTTTTTTMIATITIAL